MVCHIPLSGLDINVNVSVIKIRGQIQWHKSVCIGAIAATLMFLQNSSERFRRAHVPVALSPEKTQRVQNSRILRRLLVVCGSSSELCIMQVQNAELEPLWQKVQQSSRVLWLNTRRPGKANRLLVKAWKAKKSQRALGIKLSHNNSLACRRILWKLLSLWVKLRRLQTCSKFLGSNKEY